MTLNFRTFASSVAAVALTTGASFAAESWTMPSGSTDNFNYSQGQTENGLFTDSSPDVFGDTLLFFPNNFIADDNDTSVSDQLSFVTNAKPGVKLQKVSATLTGDYSSDDIITAIAFPGFGSTMATAQLTLINADNTADTRTQNVTFTPSSPFFGDGQFSGVASLDVPSSWVNILVQLDATLSTFNLVPSINGNALVANGNGSVIQLKGTNIELQAAAVPLPGALLAAPGAMAVAWFARRKLNKR